MESEEDGSCLREAMHGLQFGAEMRLRAVSVGFGGRGGLWNGREVIWGFVGGC